jgi:hypothetical protein
VAFDCEIAMVAQMHVRRGRSQDAYALTGLGGSSTPGTVGPPSTRRVQEHEFASRHVEICSNHSESLEGSTISYLRKAPRSERPFLSISPRPPLVCDFCCRRLCLLRFTFLCWFFAFERERRFLKLRLLPFQAQGNTTRCTLHRQRPALWRKRACR